MVAAANLRAMTKARPNGSEDHGDLDHAEVLAALVGDLAGELSLRPLLERILRRSLQLLDCDAGSITSVDEAAQVYRKEADIGVACQSGRLFPLTEGMTGMVVAARAPLVLADYSQVRGGHLSPADGLSLRAVVGVPVMWRSDVIGTCVAFSRDPARVFTDDDVKLLDLFAKHAAIAITNARLHAEAEARARVESTHIERERLAREVYDTVAQGLADILLHLQEAGEAAAQGRTRAIQTSLAMAHQAARETLEETRRDVLALAPSPLLGHSFEEAIERELSFASRGGMTNVGLVKTGRPVELAPDVTHQLFRIAQEALTNVVRHSAASTVRVGLVYGDETFTLLVQDDGRGFDAGVLNGGGVERVGLLGMAQRAQLLGGSLQIDSTPGWGTSVRAEVPRTTRGATERPGTEQLRVLVVDPQAVTRMGLATLLRRTEPALQVVGEVATGRQAVEACRALGSDVVLVELHLDDADGIDIIRQLRALVPAPQVVAMSRVADDDLVSDALLAGAAGYLDKNPDTDTDAEHLGRIIIAAARGNAVLSGPGADWLRVRRVSHGHSTLTERERQVKRLVERGLPDKRIATDLRISVKTVEKHVSAILHKTGALNRTELAARAGRGHVSPEHELRQAATGAALADMTGVLDGEPEGDKVQPAHSVQVGRVGAAG
jgi:signal transduction histidine kinase/DNA-binding NarL/FixJ family response regulator